MPSVRAAMAPLAARFFGYPSRELQARGGHGHQRQDDHDLPAALPVGARRRLRLRAAGHRQVGDRRARAPGGADHARGDRPAGGPAGDARRGRRGLRDGGLLARPGAGAHRRDRVRRRGVHQPHPGPSRLPPGHGGLLPGQAAAVPPGRGPAPGTQRRQRRGPLRPAPGRGARRRGHLRARGGGRLRRRADPLRAGALELHAQRRGASPGGRASAARALQRGQRARSSWRRRAPSGSSSSPCWRRSSRGSASRAGSSRSTRASASPCSSTTPTPPTRSRTCSPRPARWPRGPPASRAACCACSGPAGTATAPSAR